MPFYPIEYRSGTSPKPGSNVLFPSALPLASAGVGGYIYNYIYIYIRVCVHIYIYTYIYTYMYNLKYQVDDKCTDRK